MSSSGTLLHRLTVGADQTIITPNTVNAYVIADVLPKLQAEQPGLKFTQSGQVDTQSKDMKTLMSNLLIAIMLMFLMLASVLRSYIQALIILAAIPFGAVGALLGHMLLGHDLSFLSVFGIVALSGVVVNDSVVLIDYYNQLRLAGENAHEAAINAIQRRFHPIRYDTYNLHRPTLSCYFALSIKRPQLSFCSVIVLYFVKYLQMCRY